MRALRRLVQSGVERPSVVSTAHDLVRDLPARDPDSDLARIWTFVRQRLRYTHDPQGPTAHVELVKAPWVAIEEIRRHGKFVGDCDDAAVLVAALLGSLGYPTQLRLARLDPRRPAEASHVYVAAHTGRQWVVLDPIVPTFGVGDEVPRAALAGPTMRVPLSSGGDPMYRCHSDAGRRAPAGVGFFGAFRSATGGATEGGFFADAGAVFKDLLPLGVEYAKTKLRGKIEDERGGGRQIRRPAPRTEVRAKPLKPGFFQRVDLEQRKLVTDWTKVGLVGAAALGAGFLVVKAAK